MIDIYDGIKFHVCSSGYFISPYGLLLHRYKYEKEVGPIPEGYVIHHKDENRLNNNIENLQCISRSEHNKIHHTCKFISIETRRYMSELHKGKQSYIRTPEHKKIMSKACLKHQDGIPYCNKAGIWRVNIDGIRISIPKRDYKKYGIIK